MNVVTPDDWKVREDATIFHYVDSEQDQGFEIRESLFEKVPENQILACDMTATITTKTIDWTKYGVVYAGAQD